VTEDAPRPITIVNPAAPASSPDVLGHEPREPWRPSRRLLRLGAAAAVGLALLAGSTTAVLKHAAARAAAARDRAEARGVHLTVPLDGAVGGDSRSGFDNGTNNAAQTTAGTATAIVELQVDNTGRTPVELLGGVLDVPGWAVQAEGQVTTGQPSDLHLVRQLVCAQEVRSPAPDPTSLLLDVRLPSGRALRTRVPLPRLGAAGGLDAFGLAATLHEVPRQACGLLPPAQALRVASEEAPVARAGSVAVRVQLRNGGAAPLRVSGLTALPGLAVRTGLRPPLELRPHAPATRTTLVLTVHDCAAVKARPAREGESPVQVLFGKAYPADQLDVGAPAGRAVQQLIARRCG